MTARLRVLHVIPSLSAAHGGPSRAMVLIERSLAGQVQVTTLSTDDDGPGRRLAASRDVGNDTELTRVYKPKWTELYKVAPGVVPWLLENVRHFDVVHVHALFSFTSVVAAIIARNHKVPYVVRPLGTLSAYGMRRRRPLLKRAMFALVESRILRDAAAVHFTSDAELKEATRLGVPFRGVVVPLGVEGVELASSRDWAQAPPAAPTVLYLSRLDPKKNLEALLRAIALQGPSDAGVRLVVAGDGEASYMAGLRDLARTLGLDGRVDWLGHVTGPAKAAAFARAHCFALPSQSENFGIAAVEAMLAGLPCILSDGVAIAEEASRAGAVRVCSQAPEAISDAIMELLSDTAAARALGERGAAFARENYSVETMGRRLVALYRMIASPARQAAA